jgi:phosphate starvation-inducible membrane PsiE
VGGGLPAMAAQASASQLDTTISPKSPHWPFFCMQANVMCIAASFVLVVHKENRIVKINWAESLRQSVHELAESLGNLFVESFHYLALFAIGAVTAWAAVVAFLGMIEKGHITVDDILLLFIYLELGAMVGIYFKTNHMPVRFLIYVAITALTRLLISDVSHHNPPDLGVVYLSGAILLLAFAILVVRYASSQFPSVKIQNPHQKTGAGSSEHLEVEKGEI